MTRFNLLSVVAFPFAAAITFSSCSATVMHGPGRI